MEYIVTLKSVGVFGNARVAISRVFWSLADATGEAGRITPGTNTEKPAEAAATPPNGKNKVRRCSYGGLPRQVKQGQVFVCGNRHFEQGGCPDQVQGLEQSRDITVEPSWPMTKSSFPLVRKL